MTRIQEPLKWAKHPELLEEINEMVIAMKLEGMVPAERRPLPTKDNIIDLLQRCYKAINEQREDPRKY